MKMLKGWLVGDLNKGMKAMFIMMNGARLFVGIQGLGLSETAFQSSLHYSKERFKASYLKVKILLIQLLFIQKLEKI